jgi:hypothetical protein
LQRSLPAARQAAGAALSWPDEPPQADHPCSHFPCPVAADHHLLPGDPPGRGAGQPVRDAAGAPERLHRPDTRRPPWRPGGPRGGRAAAPAHLPAPHRHQQSAVDRPHRAGPLGQRPVSQAPPTSRRTGERTLTALLPAAAHPTRQRLSRPGERQRTRAPEQTLARRAEACINVAVRLHPAVHDRDDRTTSLPALPGKDIRLGLAGSARL